MSKQYEIQELKHSDWQIKSGMAPSHFVVYEKDGWTSRIVYETDNKIN